MKPAHVILIGGILLVLVGLSLVGATPGLAQGPAATAAATASGPSTPPQGSPPTFLLDYYNNWLGSAHAKVDAEAFNHWNKDGKVPADCARCHSTTGYRDYVGADGSTVAKVDADAPVGTVINCDACHNSAAASLTKVTFPSGAEVGAMGDATRCIVCHQGRASTVQVNAAIDKAKLTDSPDKVSPDLGFINIHYFAAAASLYGTEAQGGYQYAGQPYKGRFAHVDGFNTCIGCHNQHTLEVRVDACGTCHKDVKTVDDLKNIRMNGSLVDFDGDGDVKEGIAGEIQGMQELLMQTMQKYATKVAGKSIVYSAASYPYFFYDTNSNGQLDKEEAVATNAFKSFTPALLEAAYNYQMSIKDPGAFAHNAKYIIELLYDSTAALNKALGSDGVDMTKLVRDSKGHFDPVAAAFRHWDQEGEIAGSCAKCHSTTGLATFLENGTNIAVPLANSLACTTCHQQLGDKFPRYSTDTVTFPSGAKVTFGKAKDDNLCITCHQGRESTVSVNARIKASGADGDTVTDKLSFINVHYLAAGATLFGGDAKGAYQYDGKEYSGRFMHQKPLDTCTKCHDAHAGTIDFAKCTKCHEDAKAPTDIRMDAEDTEPVDYNGNGDVKEPIAAEVATFQTDLLAKIYAYASKTAGKAIVYNANSYPYWFNDLNNNGKADPEEVKSDNAFKSWTPNLLRAAYNYQFSIKDPGAFAHNADYIIQVLYDSIESVGGKDAVAKYTRPPVAESSN